MPFNLLIKPKKNRSYNFIYKSRFCIFPYNTNKGLYILSNKEKIIYNYCNSRNSIFNIINKTQSTIQPKETISIINNFLKNNILIQNNNYATSQNRKISFWINITNNCNLRCEYCYISKKKLVISDDIILKIVDKIISENKVNKYNEVIIRIAGGEPLLEFDKVKFLVNNFIKNRKKIKAKIVFILLTNGTLINNEIIKFIKKHKINVCISLDGTKKFHDLQRKTILKRGSYFLVKKAFDLLRKNRILFSTYTVITDKNIKNIPTLTKILVKNQIAFGFSFVKNSKIVNIKNSIFYLKKSLKILEKNPPSFEMLNYLLDRVKLTSQMYSCGANVNYITIDSIGNFYNCPARQDYPIGNINNTDFAQVFKRGNTNNKYLKNVCVTNKETCSKCIWKFFCSGGCSYLNYQVYKKYNAKSPYCKVFKVLLPLLLKVEANRLIKNSAN